MKANDVIL